MINRSGAEAKELAEWISVWLSPTSTTAEMAAAAEVLGQRYDLDELTQRRVEANHR